MKVNDCDCVILCGGLGRRLQGVAGDVPKVMAQVNDRPFLNFIIEYLKSQGIRRIVLCTGYKADFIEQYYRTHDLGLTIDFSEESEPLGTGGALKNARTVIFSDPFFVCNGDSLLLADLEDFLNFHREKNSAASLFVSQPNERKDFGNLKLGDDGQIIDFQEKVKGSPGNWVNAGIYCFNQSIFLDMPNLKKFSLENDFFPKLANNNFYGYPINKEFMDIGTPERYKAAKQILKNRHE